MDGFAFVQLIEAELKKRGVSKEKFYKESGISSATMSQWRKRVYSPSSAAIKKVEEYFGIELSIEQKGKAPVLTDKDRLDIAKDVEALMAKLDSAESLEFDGDPMSEEARASIRNAMMLGLEAAKVKNKERFTPKKYRRG